MINVGRRYSVRQMLTAFVRDGFIDRGKQAVFDTQDVDHDPVHWLPDP
jgi:hypothetical protein